MTEQKKVEERTAAPVHANVHVALAAAQSEMGALIKGETNPHFKSKYADLADVVAACREPFTRHGICFYHQTERADSEWAMVTVLTHGASGTEIRCAVPLIVQRNDMQGFKSATTYAKRIGLESVSGLAPEDDDGNAAANAAPVLGARDKDPQRRQSDQSETDIAITSLGNAASLDALKAIWTDLPSTVRDDTRAIKAKDRRKSELSQEISDEIPY